MEGLSSFVLGLIVGGSIAYGLTTTGFRMTLVEKGYGMYCPDTGGFAYVGECDNE